MSGSLNTTQAAHMLDDFIECSIHLSSISFHQSYSIAIDGLPGELRSQLVTLADKDAQFEGKLLYSLYLLHLAPLLSLQKQERRFSKKEISTFARRKKA